MTVGAVDYAASYFKYKTPTPIQGTPTNKTLKHLKQELQANASSVESDLGGGNHGYLGLILAGTEYATISETPLLLAIQQHSKFPEERTKCKHSISRNNTREPIDSTMSARILKSRYSAMHKTRLKTSTWNCSWRTILN